MLRETLKDSVNRVLAVLTDPDLDAMLSSRDRKEGENSGAPVIELYGKITLAVSTFGANETQILDILGLTKLFEPVFWAQLMKEGRSPTIVGVVSRIGFAKRELPRLLALLTSDLDRVRSSEAGNHPGAIDQELLHLLVFEDSGEMSSPKRIITAIESITNLYEAAADIQSIKANTLVLVACDSGSDKTFDFLGIASAVTAVKETIVAVWDRIVFYRERKIHMGLELLSESLPLLEQIEKLKQSGMSPEQCEQLKRKVIGGVQKFLDAGCTIPEVENHAHFSPRLLLAPSPKLLAAPAREAVTTDQTASSEEVKLGRRSDFIESLTAEQLRAIEAIVQRPPQAPDNIDVIEASASGDLDEQGEDDVAEVDIDDLSG